MKNLNKSISLILALSVILTITACTKNDKDNSDLINQEGVIITVNDKTITQEEFDETLLAYKKMVEYQYGEGAWDREIEPGKTLGEFYENEAIKENMIFELILIDAAEKEGITISEEELQAELEAYKGYFEKVEDYQAFLDTNGITEDDLIESIKKEFIINKYIAENIENIVPSDDDLEKVFKDIKMGEKIRASHILVKTSEEADAVMDRLDEGESFEDIAMDVSLDTSNKDKGGDLDFFSYLDMVKPFSDAAFSLEVGEISDAVQSEFGYHIIKVTDKKTDDTITVDNQKDILTERYKSFKYEELVQNLKDSAVIVNK